MKTIEINLQDETYKTVLMFREFAQKYKHPLSMDEVAELAFSALFRSFTEFMDDRFPRGQA